MACRIRIFKSETKTAQNITKKNDDDRAFSLILLDNRTRTTTSFLHDPTTNKSIHLIYIFYVFTIFILLVNQQSGKIFCCDDGGNFSNVDCSVPKVTEATDSNPVHYSINEHVIHPSSSLSMLNLVAQATNNELTSNNPNGTETNGSSTTIENHNNNHHRQQQQHPPLPRRKPELGFGNFHFPEDDEEEDDEENYDDGFSMIDRDDDETTSINTESDLHQENQQPNDSFPFDIDQLLLNQPRIERILIVGDGHKLLQPLDNYLMQQATPIDFDGCYCDHHHHHHHHHNHHNHHNHHDQPPQQPRPDYPHQYQFDIGHHSDHSSLDSNGTDNGTASSDQHPQQQQQESSPTVATTIYCYCFGETIREIPRNFSKSVRKIVLKQVGLETLRKGDLQLYPNLTEIFMQTMHHLHTIEPGAFSQLPHLMSIYIKMAPQLQKIMDGVFVGSLLKLTHLKITHSGLERFPMIRQDNPDEIISMIDFDNSRIRNITKGSIVVNAESVYIEYNQIEFISNYAFHGSKIEKLSLKGNKKLVNLQEHAFSGLYLRELDLSQTSITKLPTNGLSVSLEILRITDTFTMKEIPFIYHFESMKEAYLTYPYHCCAFKFPANHDPIEYERIKNLFNADKFCFGNKDSLENDPDRGIVRKIMDSLSSFSTTNHQKATTSSIWNGVFSPFFAFTSSPSSFEEQKLVFEKPKKYRFKRNTNSKSNRSNTINEKGALEMAKQQITSKPVFGVIVYNDEGNANQSVMVHHPYEILENRIKMAGRDQTEDEENFFKFNNQDDFNHFNNKNELPGRFGIPHKSITPKQQEFCGNIETRMQMVKCFPTPDAFNPCEDVMGKTYLRIVVWFVAFAAVSGNVSVIVVLMSSRFTFNVSKFLMINLSFADLMMGVYLFIIAVVDLRTQGVYFNYAIDWQHGIGCKVAGFITVFAQLLSIFTLTVITLERLFAITYAIQLNRRLKLNLAVKVMITGWILVILLASLPLFGISSYSKTSICLPMEHKSIPDVVYLVALLLINQFSFVIICACYSKMYFSIISQKTRATMNDMTIAKRMALLVFTDFACWAPIAFFGLTAIAGYPLIDVTNSKILLVTIYPLNSCANPFLYVIFTKQYRRDFFILVSRYGLCKTKALRYKPARNFHPINQHHHHHHHAHHHHHRTTPNTSDLMQKYNQCGKSNQVCSCPLQSFESSNLHIYQHKGQHHHHYCALYNCELSSQHCMICNPNSCSGHGSKSDNNETSRNIEDKVIGGSGAGGGAGSSNALCMNCTVMQQDFDSNNSRSLEEMEKEEKKHRKHKRCHHYPTSLSYCKYQQRGQNRGQHQHNQNHSSCNYSGSNHSNNFIKIDSPNSCNCLGGNVDLCQADPPSRNSNDGCRKNVRRHLECSNRNGPNSNEISAHNNEKKECSCSGMKQHQPRSDDLEMMDSNNPTSSSCEKVHIIRNHCKHSSCLEANGKVIFTRQRNPQLLMSANEELQKSTSHQHGGGGGNPSKRGSIFSSIFRRMSMFTKATESSTCGSHNDNHRSHHKNDSGSESGSPFSSSNSSSHHVNRRTNDHHHHHYQQYCHHYRRCYHCHNPVKRKQLAENSATEAEEKDDTVIKASCNNNNPLPIEQEREILHQALKETTTILEAVAVVEELSSGARISSMASSSSSKTKT